MGAKTKNLLYKFAKTLKVIPEHKIAKVDPMAQVCQYLNVIPDSQGTRSLSGP